MPTLTVLFAFLTAFAWFEVEALAADRKLDIPVGGQRVLKLGQVVDRIAVGDPGTIDVKVVSSRELRVLGQREGTTDLTVWFADSGASQSYYVVVGTDLSGLQSELDGDPALVDVRAVETGKSTVLKGQVDSLEAQQRAKSTAESYLGKKVNDMTTIADRRMVAVEVRFAAVSTSTLKALGLNFQSLGNNFQFAAIGPNASTSFGYTPGAGLDPNTSLPLSQAFNLFLAWPGSDLLGVISALSSANLAQLLAEPTLLVRSGEDADFLAGGEIPIPVPQSGVGNGTVTIEYKKFGVQLGVAATVLDNDRIVLKVSPEVSELDYTNALVVQGFRIPALRTRLTRTTIELGDGQSFVLAGLMYSTSGNIEERIPGIGELPIVGAFFKRTQNARERQELIIVATPRLVSPMEAGQVPALPGVGQQYNSDLGQTLLNVNTLDDHIVKHGLMR
jgi:pilus assembly protein CpaC